jgi:hypothetical protein
MYNELPNTENPPFLQELSNQRHNTLLDVISNLPFADEHIAIYRNCIEGLYEKYNDQIKEITETIRIYGEVAADIKKKRSLNNGKKYTRVRKPIHVNKALRESS